MNKWQSCYHWNRPIFFLCNKAYKYYTAEFGPRTSPVPSQFLTAKFSFQLSADEKLWHIDNLIFVQQKISLDVLNIILKFVLPGNAYAFLRDWLQMLLRKQHTLGALYASLWGIRMKWVGIKMFQYAIGNEIWPNRFLYSDYSFFLFSVTSQRQVNQLYIPSLFYF